MIHKIEVQYSTYLHEMKRNIIQFNMHVHSNFRDRKDLDQTRIKSDEDAVKGVIHTIDAFVNPFQNDHTELAHLASGKVATNAVALDMTNMFERGEKAAVDFINTNVLCTKPDIYAAIRKNNLKTFSNEHKGEQQKWKRRHCSHKEFKKAFCKNVAHRQKQRRRYERGSSVLIKTILTSFSCI